MKKKDTYEELLKYYEFLTDKTVDREAYKDALRQTVTPEEVEVFFLVPFTGGISIDKLESMADKKGISKEQLQLTLEKLAREGFIWAYQTPRGRAFERGHIAHLSEQQVRKQEATEKRIAFAKFWYSNMEGQSRPLSKTPYYRVVPVEAALTHTPATRKIDIDVPVPDPRAVLPLDVVSKMVATRTLIGVAECTCRKTNKVMGQGCEHPMETCFVFNEVGETLIGAGIARKIDYNEALRILGECNAAGLVHNIDNAEGEFTSLCNCCPCSCVLFKTVGRGATNTMAKSRFISSLDSTKCRGIGDCVKICPVHAITMDGKKASFDQSKCIGCGKCVVSCPSGAIKLVLRPKEPKMYSTYKSLWGHIAYEAFVQKTLNKITGKGSKPVKRKG
ncbi:MAG: 4Fe-4S binding protein [Dehalococcoidia bacterium]|nr:4Fe-4S binding protein [Dehalococcoidia bacterium]